VKWLPVAVLVTLLAGCSSLRTAPSAPPIPELASSHLATVAALRNWRLTARIGVQRDNQGFSADLDWREQDGAFDLRLAAPLNGGTFALAGDADAVSLRAPKGEHYVADSAEALMQTHFGWALPVSGARHWIKGIPAPESTPTQEVRDAEGRWTDFAQDGWRVSIVDYTRVAGTSLPRKLFLNRDDMKVRLVIKAWERD